MASAPPPPQTADPVPLARALAVVTATLERPEAALFAAPVDAEALGLTDYRAVVKRPMDLGTVAAKLRAAAARGWTPPLPFGGFGGQAGAAALLDDVRQVWHNCRLYNAPGSEIDAACGAAEAFFCAAWNAAKLSPRAVARKAPTGEGAAAERRDRAAGGVGGGGAGGGAGAQRRKSSGAGDGGAAAAKRAKAAAAAASASAAAAAAPPPAARFVPAPCRSAWPRWRRWDGPGPWRRHSH